jgi:Domain of unknown function (DUF1996)
MQASSERTWQVRLALMLIIGVAAAAACVVALLLWKAPVASAQDEGGDPTGANFVVSCGFTGIEMRRAVDPIVDPGNPNSFHSHDFYGNTTTNENSTYDTLLGGGTTCNKPMDTAAYWHPTVSWTPTRGKPKTLTASKTFFYYRAGLKTPADVKPFPPGLKVVTEQGKKVEWRCQGGTWSPTPPTQCGDNATLVVRIFFPDCLAVDSAGKPLTDTRDAAGKTLYVPDDHRSHMVAATSEVCPPDHPYPVPRLQTNFLFKDAILSKRGKPTLSTKVDPTTGNYTGDYSTMHVDFFNAWQPFQKPLDGTLDDLVTRCINPGPFSATKPKPIDCQ